MVSFTDIHRQKGTVKVGDLEFSVTGLTLDQIADLFRRFPVIATFFSESTRKQTSIVEMINLAPGAITAIISGGSGTYGNEAEERAIAENLAIEAKIDFLEEIWRLTLPNGVGPLAARLARLTGAAAGEEAGEAAAPAAATAASGTATATSSPKPPKS